MNNSTKNAAALALGTLLLVASPAAAAGGPVVFIPIAAGGVNRSTPPAATTTRTVNAPFLNVENPYEQMAIFWYGKVSQNETYSDVRVSYDNDSLLLNVATFDRQQWYDPNPNPAALNQWDSVSVYLQVDGAAVNAPNDKSYRIDAGLGPDNQWAKYRAVYRGNGGGWSPIDAPADTKYTYRGDSGPNSGGDGRGWVALFDIPFSSLGVSRPANSATWRMALNTFNRYGQSSSAINVSAWPENAKRDVPASWGNLRFGLPAFVAAASTPGGATVVRHRLNGIEVTEANAGGYTVCGGDPSTFWTQWGERTWSFYNAELSDFNIQNQGDVADWPCFAKYYATFPLKQVPAGKVIRSASLTLYQFSNAQPQDAKPSLIQVMMVDRDFDPKTLNWNNAPMALENVGRSWVDVLLSPVGHPGVPRVFDVSYAVAQAYASGQPLRLVMYSAAFDYHSGKYFVSSGTGDWNALGRPTLNIEWGNP